MSGVLRQAPFQAFSPRMRAALARVLRYAKCDVSLTLVGETGTGKSLLARLVHEESERRNKPFVVLNCATLPADLAESELFGHVRGAFSGAISNKVGLIAAADGGTLFLDEIGELELHLQAKLLRAIEEHVYRRVGATTEQISDFRLITATNRDLVRMMAEGKFRSDLYYRISTAMIHLPALRERTEDIASIVADLIERNRLRCRRPNVTIDESFVRQLMQHDWPGNVRELDNVLLRCMVETDHDVLTAADLQFLPGTERVATDDFAAKIERVRQCLAQSNKRGRRGKISIRDAAKELGESPSSLHRFVHAYSLR